MCGEHGQDQDTMRAIVCLNTEELGAEGDWTCEDLGSLSSVASTPQPNIHNGNSPGAKPKKLKSLGI